MADKTNHTPMMEQYLQIKSQYPDTILFFRLGDFYEMFNEDAIEVSKVLEITLTSRNKNADNPIPMCGVPHHSAKSYINRLVNSGYKVAICEQMEDPKLTKGMVKREVVRIITPGTIIDEDALIQKENNYIAALHIQNKHFYFTYADISTGEIYLTHTETWEQVLSEVQSIAPSELVIDKDFNPQLLETITSAINTTISYHQVSENQEYTWQLSAANEDERQLLNLLFDYLLMVQKQSIHYIKPVERYELNRYLRMNYFTKHQLELTQSLRTQRKKGSLLWFLDQTKTAMGGRLLRQWVEKPLFDKQSLIDRHTKVEFLLKYYFERMDLLPKLRDVYDLERLIAKISMKTANARDIDQLRHSLRQIPGINLSLRSMNEQEGLQIFHLLDEFTGLLEHIDEVLVDEPPISIKDGNLIKSGYHADLDHYRDALDHGQEWLSELQLREREKTGIKTLKVGYNKVFGYYIELSRLQAQNLDDSRYHRKQTLTNAERYITEELKEIEKTILEAQEKSQNLEYEIFVDLRDDIVASISQLQVLAQQIAELDVLCNFAGISEREGFVRAQISEQSSDIYLEDSRHPVVEHLIGSSEFVPNNLMVTPQKNILLLTGPNMSGKSTYMRQIAFAVILNQIGCFVPAKKAKLPLIDSIFTRIGSSDDISQGQSTFMVEMMETNVALTQATNQSLLLFDELGRGTSTYDGIALAQGILNYIAKNIHAVTIFSTHYHELTRLDQDLSQLKNIHVGASENNGDLVFLHKIIDGPADKSYGIHVAKLAGLPMDLIKDSQLYLTELEENANQLLNNNLVNEQLYLFNDPLPVQGLSPQEEKVIETIKHMDVNNLSPYQALEKLFELKYQLENE